MSSWPSWLVKLWPNSVRWAKKDILQIGPPHSIAEILPIIGRFGNPHLDGIPVKTGGKRLRTFLLKGTTCVRCGVIGTRFYKEYDVGSKGKTAFLSLYAIRGDGTEVLMTRDHIVPQARGGVDSIENSQPMCISCNSDKGCRWEPPRHLPLRYFDLIKDLVFTW